MENLELAQRNGFHNPILVFDAEPDDCDLITNTIEDLLEKRFAQSYPFLGCV